MTTADTLERPAVVLRGRRLEYFTILWNTLEVLIAIGSGIIAGSISLVGFGIDSFIEVTSGSVLLWRMAADLAVHPLQRDDRPSFWHPAVCFFCTPCYMNSYTEQY